jgi:hypothetical protein
VFRGQSGGQGEPAQQSRALRGAGPVLCSSLELAVVLQRGLEMVLDITFKKLGGSQFEFRVN